jgi:transcriptional regulator with XRE-family HTH domain
MPETTSFGKYLATHRPGRYPTLGRYIWATRDERRFTRRELAEAIRVSESYIVKLEHGQKSSPGSRILDALADVLSLNEDERHHLYNLAGVERIMPAPTVDELRAALTPNQRRTMANLEPNLVAYYDMRWNLLAHNDSHNHAFPGLRDVGNLLHWLFTEQARHIVLHWEHETAIRLAYLRGRLATSSDPGWAEELFEVLERYPDFRRLWRREYHVLYGGSASDPLVWLRDPDTGEPYAIRVEEFITGKHWSQTMSVFIGNREDTTP